MLADIDYVALATELAYARHSPAGAVEDMPGYEVDRVFACRIGHTGFDAIAFVNPYAQRLILAIRGSDDARDFVADANLGIPQYEANRQALVDYLGSYLSSFHVILAGHSLGGGLAQYLAYDLALAFPRARDRITLHTHNSFGGIIGITRMHGRYDPAVLAGVTVRNIRHPDDPVSRIGGQVGGNVLHLPDINAHIHDGVLFSHANARFLPRNGESRLAVLQPAIDDPIDLTRTMLELGPELSEALSRLITRGSRWAALGEVYRLLLRLPVEERNSVLQLLNEILPFRGLWQRSFGRWLRPRSRHLPTAKESPHDPSVVQRRVHSSLVGGGAGARHCSEL